MDHIEIKDLTYKYPSSKRNILSDISLKIKQGELCSIIGPNGGGKTTLCHAIRGFVPHFYQGDMQGDIWIDGRNTREMSVGELALKVGFVFQNPFTQISGIADTVYEELAFGLENLGVQPAEMRERIERVLNLTRLEKLRDRTPFELSGGQMQRVALASIIVMEPEILVIDEPTSQLDPEGTEEVFEIIRLMKESGKTIILVEHKMELVAQYSDRVVLIDEGEIVRDGSTEEVFSDPAVLQHGTALPQYALLGLEMKKRDIPLNRTPITERMALDEVSRLLSEG